MLSVDEAAARLGCAPMDLWRLIHAGECPGLIRLGRHYIEAGRLEEVLKRAGGATPALTPNPRGQQVENTNWRSAGARTGFQPIDMGLTPKTAR